MVVIFIRWHAAFNAMRNFITRMKMPMSISIGLLPSCSQFPFSMPIKIYIAPCGISTGNPNSVHTPTTHCIRERSTRHAQRQNETKTRCHHGSIFTNYSRNLAPAADTAFARSASTKTQSVIIIFSLNMVWTC